MARRITAAVLGAFLILPITAATAPSAQAQPPSATRKPTTVDGLVTWLPAATEWDYWVATPPQQWPMTPAEADVTGAGPAPLGFGEGDEATVVPSGGDAGRRPISTYFSRAFYATPLGMRDLTLRLRRDDGAVVYLNGREVARTNLPSGPLTPQTLASSAASDDGRNWRVFALNPRDLVVGRNVLSVAVHQSAAASSDLTFAASLTSHVGSPTINQDLGPGDVVSSQDGRHHIWGPYSDGEWEEFDVFSFDSNTSLTSTIPLVSTTFQPEVTFSPDSRRAHVVRWRTANAIVDMSDLAEIPTRTGRNASWSPDSRHLASSYFSMTESTDGLVLTDARDGSRQLLPCADVPLSDEYRCDVDDDIWPFLAPPVWSPDGTKVRFRNHPASRELVADLAEGQSRLPRRDDMVARTVLPAGSSWEYSTGAAPESSWRLTTGSWPIGRAELGYGDGDERTVIRWGNDPLSKPMAAYFRTQVPASTGLECALRFRRDDGVAIYRKGVEVTRSNLPTGPLTPTTAATAAAADDGTKWREVPLKCGGPAVLAAEVHQNAPDSSDLSFDAAVIRYTFAW